MLAGCRTCWTYQLLHTMSLLGVLSRTSWDRRAKSLLTGRALYALISSRDTMSQNTIKNALLGQLLPPGGGGQSLRCLGGTHALPHL
jgi:hypothetical protein